MAKYDALYGPHIVLSVILLFVCHLSICCIQHSVQTVHNVCRFNFGHKNQLSEISSLLSVISMDVIHHLLELHIETKGWYAIALMRAHPHWVICDQMAAIPRNLYVCDIRELWPNGARISHSDCQTLHCTSDWGCWYQIPYITLHNRKRTSII